MSAKAVLPCALVLSILTVSARAEDDARPLNLGTDPAPAPELVPPALAPVPRLSDWMTYTKPDCCGPIGRNGMVGTELYARSGWSFPVGGSIFNTVLDNGWMIAGGARVLFFNEPADTAWVVDLGMSYNYNHGRNEDFPITLFVLQPAGGRIRRDVTVRAYNRTYVNASLGQEWFLNHSANNRCGWTWRAGWDAGGRYGTSRVDLDEFGMRSFFRRNDVIGAVFGAIHSDIEVPCGCCTFVGGLRVEWGYNWSDIFQQGNPADLQEVNALVNLGVRY